MSRKSPLTADDWARHQDADGRMKDVPDLKHAVFKGVRTCLWVGPALNQSADVILSSITHLFSFVAV